MNAIRFVSKVLENFRPYIPLMQSIVWPTFLGIVIWHFRKQLEVCIEAIRSRIESGSSVEAGPFKLGAMTSASPKERIDKLNQEAAEAEQPGANEGTIPKIAGSAPAVNLAEIMKRDIRASYLIAEELVINKLSEMLKTKFERGVKSYSYIFDGVSVREYKIVAVEVKYVRRGRLLTKMVTESLKRIEAAYRSFSERDKLFFTLIFAVVVDQEYSGTRADVETELAPLRDKFLYPINFMVFRMEELEKDLV